VSFGQLDAEYESTTTSRNFESYTPHDTASHSTRRDFSSYSSCILSRTALPLFVKDSNVACNV